MYQPLNKTKGKKQKGAPPKHQSTRGGRGGGSNCGGGGGGGGHGGCGNGQSTGTSTDNAETSKTTVPKPGHNCRHGRSQGVPIVDSYPVPNFKAVVVTDAAPAPTSKDYTTPDNRLAEELAKYFEERTEIKYNVLIDKMKSAPEADIMHLLGIKPKAEDTKDKGNNNSESRKTVDELSLEEQKEVDDFMESFKEDTKSKLEKEIENDSEHKKSVQELLPQDRRWQMSPKKQKRRLKHMEKQNKRKR